MSVKYWYRKTCSEYSKAGFSPLFIRKCSLKALQFVEEFFIGLVPRKVFYLNVLDKLKIKPSYLDIETTNRCNANCSFCAYRYMKRQKGTMDDSIFEKTVRDYVEIGGGNVGLTPVPGEPLLDSKIIERIKFLRSFESIKKIDLVTNGILLDKFAIKDLLTSGIDRISVSFGGVDKEEYKELFGVDMSERVCENLLRIGDANKELGVPVAISVSVRTAKKLSDFTRSQSYRRLSKNFRIEYKYNYHSWGGVIKDDDLKGEMKMMSLRNGREEPCGLLYSGLRVCWNGDVTPCWCGDVDSDLAIGNISEQHLLDIWMGKALHLLRESFSKGASLSICAECEHYRGLKSFKNIRSLKSASDNYRSFINSKHCGSNCK